MPAIVRAAMTVIALPRSKLLAISTLLEDAVRVEKDLTRRLSERPGKAALLEELVEYQELVDRLIREHGIVLGAYLTKVRARLLVSRSQRV
jgi:hypothetical protein